MIAAIAGNNIGGCGVAFSSALSMVACMGDQVGTQSTLARALAYAAAPDLENAAIPRSAGADIIACSLGPNTAKWEIRQVMSDAIDFVATSGREGRGCAIFWACTNGNFPIGSDEICSHQHVTAVGRSRKTDQDDGSGFGPQLEFLAPGVDVRIPASGGGYQTTTGTSFAGPCATGVGALALSRHPELTAVQLRQLMRDTCDKIGSLPYIGGRNVRFGHGRINAKRAVDEAIRLAALA
jgi:subtilisin family serine protease